MKIIAKPLKIIINSNYSKVLNEITNLIEELDVEMILVGLPITMKNTSSEQTKKVVKFINQVIYISKTIWYISQL